MADDDPRDGDGALAAFVRDHHLDDPRVAAALAPWQVERIAASTVRTAVELTLVRPGHARVLVALEPRVDGAEHLAATATLHLSYYAEPGVDHGAAAAVVRALAGALRELEPGGPSRRALPIAGRRFVELRINRTCNERCRFCNTPADSPTIAPGPEAVLAQIAEAARAGCRDLLLSGRETTLDPRLPEYLAAARAAGIATRRVQTNGTTLGHRPLLDRLVGAGMNAVELSLHTLDPDTFEALIGPRALLGHATAGLDALAAAPGVAVTVVVVLTAHNAAEVPALVATIATRWPHVRGLVLSPVAPVGDGAGALDLLVPYEVLGPIVGDALRTAAARGLAASVPARCGLPPCALPADVRDRHDALRSRGAPIEPGKHKPPGCAACALDRVCGGAWTRYLERHGAGALVPV